MPWIFNLPNGRSLSYPTQEENPETGMSFPEAQARARRELNPNLVNTERPYEGRGTDISPWRRNALEEAAEGRQWWRDMGDQALGGIADIGTWFGQVVNQVDPTATGSREEGRRPIGDIIADATRSWGEEQTASLSPELLRDQNAENPFNAGNVSGSAVRSLPSMLPVIAAARYGRVAQGAAEGAMGAGGVAEAVDESIRDFAAMDPDGFASSPLGREALAATNGHFGRAVEVASNRAKGLAPAIAGTLTATISRVIGEDIGSALRGGSRREAQTLIARVALGAGRESAEEFLQSGQEQIASNLAISQIDGRSWDEGALESAGMGAITAAPMGGAFGALAHVQSGRQPPQPQPAGPAVQGPVMPPPGHPNRGPASGTGNPTGWVPPDTQAAEDAEYSELGENRIAAEPGQTPPPRERPGWKKGTESWAEDPPGAPEQPEPSPGARARAEEYAANYDGEEGISDPADDELYAGALEEQFQSLGMAAREAPPKKKGTKRTVRPVPLFRFNREAIEAEDTDAAAIYNGAVSDQRSVADTATFRTYSKAEQSLFADPDDQSDPAEAAGYGLRVIDTLPDGTQRVSFLDIGAKTLEEARANAGKFGITEDMEAAQTQPEPQQKPTQPEPPKETVAEEPTPAPTGTAIELKGPLKNLKPGANEALKAYRTKGEQGLQAYLAGLNITASKSLLRNLGGGVGRSDSMTVTRGKIVQQVRKMAKSGDARALPEPSAPVVNDNVSAAEYVANQPISDKESFGEDWPANTKEAEAVTEPEAVPAQEQKPQPVAPKATPTEKPAPVKEQKPESKSESKPKKALTEEDVVEMPKREARSASQIKSLLRDIAALEEDAYDDALPKMKITPEEAAAVREAMKTDKGLDNLRSTFNDVLASQRKTKKSKQTQEEPKEKAKPKARKEASPEETLEKVRKRRDAADRTLASSMAAGQPQNYNAVRTAVMDWLEMERDRQGVRNEDLWRKQWPISREEALINRVWRIVSGDGPMESRATEESKPIQARDLPITKKKWASEMERAIKAAAECAAGLGAAGAATAAGVATVAAGLGAGAVLAAPIAALLGMEGQEATRFNEQRSMIRDFRVKAGLAPADAYVDDEMNYQAPQYDEEGFIEPSLPLDETAYSAAELRAARDEIIATGTIPDSLITEDDIRRQAFIRRHNLRRPLTELNAPPEDRSEESIRIPQ